MPISKASKRISLMPADHLLHTAVEINPDVDYPTVFAVNRLFNKPRRWSITLHLFLKRKQPFLGHELSEQFVVKFSTISKTMFHQIPALIAQKSDEILEENLKPVFVETNDTIDDWGLSNEQESFAIVRVVY